MRITFPFLAALLATTGCSQSEQNRQSGQDLKSYDVAEAPAAPAPSSEARSQSEAMSPPGIAPTAAPGVAFNYRYGFRLPAQRISEVQEQHAAACEKLGIDRCRITGMHYALVNDRDIEGMLSFKLDPAIARQFGKQGIDAVVRAEGMLARADVSGEDAGSEIASATRSEAELNEDLRKIEEQLARSGLRSPERAELQVQAQQLRESIRSIHATKSAKQESLARTPITFIYGSGDLVPGFDNQRSIRTALRDAGDNFLAGVAWILVILISLLPWAALAAIGIWLWRRISPSLRGRKVEQTAVNLPAD